MPLILTWVQYVGMRQGHVGPAWTRGHLRDVGLAVPFGITMAFIYATFRPRFAKSDESPEAVLAWFTRAFPWCCGVVTTVWIVLEFAQMVFLREASVAHGYSGRLDVLDLAAYVLGIGIIILNHLALRMRAGSPAHN